MSRKTARRIPFCNCMMGFRLLVTRLATGESLCPSVFFPISSISSSHRRGGISRPVKIERRPAAC